MTKRLREVDGDILGNFPWIGNEPPEALCKHPRWLQWIELWIEHLLLGIRSPLGRARLMDVRFDAACYVASISDESLIFWSVNVMRNVNHSLSHDRRFVVWCLQHGRLSSDLIKHIVQRYIWPYQHTRALQCLEFTICFGTSMHNNREHRRGEIMKTIQDALGWYIGARASERRHILGHSNMLTHTRHHHTWFVDWAQHTRHKYEPANQIVPWL